MPTAGRFVGAMLFGFIAWYVSELFKPLMLEGTSFGNFSEYNAVLGIVVGWVMLGPRAHPNRSASIGAGLTTAFVLLFWGLLIHGIVDMLKLTLRKRYDGAGEAVIGVFQLMMKYAIMMATPEIIMTLLIGGMLAGAISGWAQRRWM
ncbi:hypothetical protein JI58_09795 [Marinosulfonomonas sp. PRT-SC04]|nr:hypothetical protein JI58_09795 [Marinosulfonomonas sp. PRT-SC04]